MFMKVAEGLCMLQKVYGEGILKKNLMHGQTNQDWNRLI